MKKMSFCALINCFLCVAIISGCSLERNSNAVQESDRISTVTAMDPDSFDWETIPESESQTKDVIESNKEQSDDISAGNEGIDKTAVNAATEKTNNSDEDNTNSLEESSAWISSVAEETTELEPELVTDETNDESYLVVLDPGHTAHISNETEPLGPGSSEMKAKDTLGTSGVETGLHEYELNLMICQKLETELLQRGYQVILTHNTNDTTISCAERAQVANNNKADIFLRVHADGSTDSSAQGAMTICITSGNPYHPELYTQSKLLSQKLVDTYCSETGRRNRGVWETDSMKGNNWSEVPASLIEMGFMTNPDEDLWMASDGGQSQIVSGIADGIDRYFKDFAE